VILVFAPPDDTSEETTAEQPPAPDVAAPARFSIPAEAAPATIDQLKQEAMQVADALLVRFPRSAEAHHVMALLQNAFCQTEQAEKYWRKCIQLEPTYTAGHIGLASLAVDRGDDERAVGLLNDALDAGCRETEIYNALATSLMHLGRFQEAVDALRECPTAFPESPESWYLLGQAQMQRGEFQQAEQSLSSATELDPAYTDAHYALAMVCVRQGKYESAAAHRKRFAELKTEDREEEDDRFRVPDLQTMRERTAATRCAAGSVWMQNEGLAEAEKHLLRAVQIAPDLAESYKLLASLYRREDRINDALVAQRHLVTLDAENIAHYFNLASLLTKSGDIEAAESALRQAIAVKPDAAAAYALLAQLYMKTGKLEAARTAAETGVRHQPTAAGYQLLASICLRLNQQSHAQAAMAAAERLASRERRGP
jgi:tetratricopeptide (TPR) repeat protein